MKAKEKNIWTSSGLFQGLQRLELENTETKIDEEYLSILLLAGDVVLLC